MVVRPRPLIVTVATAAVVILIAATFGWWAATRPVTGTPTAAPPSPDPAHVTIVPGPDATGVDPLSAVRVTAADGTLTDVRMTNDGNAPVPGVLTPDAQTWKPTVPLGYGRTYTLTVASRGLGGVPATQTSAFTTLTPSNQTKATLTTTSGAALTDGGTYGVGTVIVAHFDEPIADRAAAQKRLAVTTDPAVRGSWFWIDDQNAHWRPQQYYAAETKVTVAVNIYGADLGGGLYGQEPTEN